MQPQLSNRAMPGTYRAGSQLTIRVRTRSGGASMRLPIPTAGVDWWRRMSVAAMEMGEYWVVLLPPSTIEHRWGWGYPAKYRGAGKRRCQRVIASTYVA